MTGQPGSWYLDHLRAELERVATIEDRRERRSVLRGRRMSWGWPAAIVAGAVLVAIIVIVGAASAPRDEERIARPIPPPVAATDPEAILRRLDGLYIAEITAATLRREADPGAPPGWWRIVVRSAERTLTVSAPEGPDSGDFTLTITSAGPGKLTFAPATSCPGEGLTASSVDFTLSPAGVLALRNARGGCRADWNLLTSTSWFKE